MNNPFEVLEKRLENIETLLIDIKHPPQQQKIETEVLLTIKQASEFLKLSVPTIYSKVSRGEIPVMKQAKRLYFSSVELMQFVKDGRRKTNSEIEAEAVDYLIKNKGGKKC